MLVSRNTRVGLQNEILGAINFKIDLGINCANTTVLINKQIVVNVNKVRYESSN